MNRSDTPNIIWALFLIEKLLAVFPNSYQLDKVYDTLINFCISTDRKQTWGDINNLPALLRWLAVRRYNRLRMQNAERREKLAAMPAPPGREREPIEVVADDEVVAVVGQAVERLPEDDQIILDAFVAAGTARKAAKLLGITIGAYRYRFHKIVERLQAELEDVEQAE